MKAFAVKRNAKENSRQTCDGDDLKVSCREKTLPYLLTIIRRSVKALAVKSNAKVNSRHAFVGGHMRKVEERNSAISFDLY